MSKEFFETMEEISKVATKIKFLEGTHPEIYNKHFEDAKRIQCEMENLDEAIAKELKTKASSTKPKRKKA